MSDDLEPVLPADYRCEFCKHLIAEHSGYSCGASVKGEPDETGWRRTESCRCQKGNNHLMQFKAKRWARKENRRRSKERKRMYDDLKEWSRK